MKTDFQELYEKYPKLTAFDLSILHIFKDESQKPYIMINGKVSYYLEFNAVNEKSEIIDTIPAKHMHEAKELLFEKINKGTLKFEKWQKNNFAISYLPLREGIYTYVKKKLISTFPEMQDHWGYWYNVYDQYDNILDINHKKVYSYKTKSLKFRS
jgi:hypothetical protein